MMHIHYRANMDFWDPAFVNPLASVRRILLFDQAGVGRSTGEVQTTFQGWANEALSLIEALRIAKIDLLGFSMGGAAMQMVALTAPHLVNKLILAGTAPSAPSLKSSDIKGVVWPRDVPPQEAIEALSQPTHSSVDVLQAIALSFFPLSDEGRAAASRYLTRVGDRDVAGEPKLLELLDSGVKASRQRAAYGDWMKPNAQNSYYRLGELKMPVLVLNGDDDLLIPTSMSWELAKKIPNAQLIIYPRAGHGFIWQYAGLVAKHVNEFLDRTDTLEMSKI